MEIMLQLQDVWMSVTSGLQFKTISTFNVLRVLIYICACDACFNLECAINGSRGWFYTLVIILYYIILYYIILYYIILYYIILYYIILYYIIYIYIYIYIYIGPTVNRVCCLVFYQSCYWVLGPI